MAIDKKKGVVSSLYNKLIDMDTIKAIQQYYVDEVDAVPTITSNQIDQLSNYQYNVNVNAHTMGNYTTSQSNLYAQSLSNAYTAYTTSTNGSWTYPHMKSTVVLYKEINGFLCKETEMEHVYNGALTVVNHCGEDYQYVGTMPNGNIMYLRV